MRLPAQTRLSVRLTVSQTAGAGAREIECLIIVICRRLAANLEGEKKKKRKRRRHQESVNICLAGAEHRGGCVLPTAAAADTKSHSLITGGVRIKRGGIRQRRMDTNGGSSFTRNEEREAAMSRPGGQRDAGIVYC